MTRSGVARMPDWLVMGQERWDLVERRNQLLIGALARRNPAARVLFVEPARRLRGITDWRAPRPRQVGRNIWAVTPVRPVPDGLSRRLSDKLEAAQIRRAVRSVGLDRAMLWTQDPRAADLLDMLPCSGLVYDLTDDWVAFETDGARANEVRARVSSLCRRANLVLACSRWLEQDARRVSSRVLYLPNAVGVAAAGGAVPDDLELDPGGLEPDGEAIPDDLERLPRPRLGYVGTLHAARLDVDLVVQAAQLRRDWSFAFLGPDLLPKSESARLFAPANVHHLGVRSHAKLGAYLRGFDAGLVPNLLNDFTRSLDPLKTYEYLAAGLPVLSTPAGIPQELAPLVVTVTTPQELVEQAQRAIDANGPSRAAERRAAVAAENWDARAVQIEAALGVGPQPPERSSSAVSVVIVSFNTRDLLERCLTDLHAQEGVQLQTIVVDNASTDGSPELVKERFPDVELLELPDNVGFARANNLAFEQCHGEYVLLLNSDAFLHPGALRELVAAAGSHPEAGALGPRVLNVDTTLQRSAWPFPGPARLLLEALGLHRILRRTPLYEDLGTWDHDTERTVDFLIGACLLLRADALREVSGFDESFWMYGEEADLQKRLEQRGFTVLFTPGAQVTHVGGASAMDSADRLRHFYAGQMRFLRKHHGDWAWWVGRAALLIGSVLRRRWVAVRTAILLKPQLRR